ncbi:MAG: aryl-sulfate sulfotransferase [Caldilineaceae bacterium]|nr:aryl-sulfate sulfotransferase [Caldilineaceae bacterium]
MPYNLKPYGGPVDGTLIDIVIQEQNAAKQVVFEWRGSDHIPITDTYESFTDGLVDYLHTNAMAVDRDGHLLISSRNTSEITKINRQTGAVIWRLGGKSNQFTFTNDPGFWRQHDIRRQANGNLTLFDNGNEHTPPHSRAVEYAIDETAKTITRVWQYPPDTSEYSFIMSNAQRLPNGNTLIGWGDQPKMTEVRPDGTIALAMRLGAPRTGFETTITMADLPADTCFFQTRPIHAQERATPFSNLIYRTDQPACRVQLTFAYLPWVAVTAN